MLRNKVLAVLFGAALFFGTAVAQGEPRFTIIDFPGAFLTQALDINAVGDIVGRYDDTVGKSHGFLLSQGSFTTIDPPGATGVVLSPPCTFTQGTGATATRASGINPSGDIVGRYADAAGVTHGFLLSQGVYTTIDFPGSIYTQGKNINAVGEITGDYVDRACRTHGFLLTQGAVTTQDFPGAFFIRALRHQPRRHYRRS